MVKFQIFVEGGGDRNTLKRSCRNSFRQFVERAGVTGDTVQFIACGSRSNAYREFTNYNGDNNTIALLLVDAETRVESSNPWQHLSEKDNWTIPRNATNEQCHFMVQIMESWFLADKETLAKYYGQKFQTNALPNNPNIENISKQDVLNGLNRATQNTQKGKYDKGDHSFEILAQIDPEKVQQASPYAKRFITMLKSIP